MMNQNGQILPVLAFIASLLLAGLFIVVGEPILDAMLDSIPQVAGDGSTPRLIIFGASLLIVLGGLWLLTHPQQVRWNA